jgi:drug/metabolite transporter (DMT)-like permease
MTIVDQAPMMTQAQSVRRAELALLLATLVWGSSFTWAKEAGDALNRLSGAGANAAMGPLLLMGLRFTLGGLLWLVLFSQARRGWTLASVGRGAVLGLLLGCGLGLQVLGLDRTSEAVSAFLTSLTIIWVPALMTLWMRRPPKGWFWVGVLMAAVGIWLMTGAMPAGFGPGGLMGLACSIAFAVHIIVLNVLVPQDSPWRMTAAQLLVVGLMALAACAITIFRPGGKDPIQLWPAFSAAVVWLNLLLLVAFPTVISFGIMSYFQPRVDPSRATLIYLLEPIFAAGYAWLSMGRTLGAVELCGAGLILAANAVVELVGQRRAKPPT